MKTRNCSKAAWKSLANSQQIGQIKVVKIIPYSFPVLKLQKIYRYTCHFMLIKLLIEACLSVWRHVTYKWRRS